MGANVAVVSGGDPGVFAMAAALCAEIEAGPPEWRELDIAIVPGITAILAVAGRAPGPLGDDLCRISLPAHLNPLEMIAPPPAPPAGASFVVALYNHIS